MCPEMKTKHKPGRPISAMAVDIYALGATIKAVKDPKMNHRGVWERNFFRLLSAMMDISPQKRPTANQVSHALTSLHYTERVRLQFELPSTKRVRQLLRAAVAEVEPVGSGQGGEHTHFHISTLPNFHISTLPHSCC